MKNSIETCQKFEEIKISLSEVIISIKTDEPKRVEAEWYVGLTDSMKRPKKRNHLFYCCSVEDAKQLKDYILVTHKEFNEGKNYGKNQKYVYIVAEY